MHRILLPPTINLHSIKPCNFSCRYCYAGFEATKRASMPQAELHEILRQIAAVPPYSGLPARKVTFAGGEPLLSGTLSEDLGYAKRLGLVTSLVTNGWFLLPPKLAELAGALDWLALSVDSLDPATNVRIGRAHRGMALDGSQYLARIQLAKALGIRVKINTVVSQANQHEDFSEFVLNAMPSRWKILQATRIEEENGADFSKWEVSAGQFAAFVERHAWIEHAGVAVVPETQTQIYGSYAMVGPDGCFFDNSFGTYRRSRPIVEVGILEAFSEVAFAWEKFHARDGLYDFATASLAEVRS
jgi:radical S-adenosyl methionine domain-containing protein 2